MKNLTAIELKERLIRTSVLIKGLKKRVAARGMVNAYYALTNTVPPLPESEPATWEKTIPLNISTEHPYKSDQFKSWEVRIPGATQIALYFENFETEDPYVRVTLENENGARLSDFAGVDGKGWSEPIRGDYVKVIFNSDARNNFYGFDLTRAAYR